MTYPNTPLDAIDGAGAFQIGGGDFTFGQDYTDTIIKGMFRVPAPTLSNAIDLLQEYLLKLPLETLKSFKDIIPGTLDEDFISVITAVDKIIDSLQDTPVFMALDKFISWIGGILAGIISNPLNLLNFNWWVTQTQALFGTLPGLDVNQNLLEDPGFGASSSVSAVDGWSWDSGSAKSTGDGLSKSLFHRTRVDVSQGNQLSLSGKIKTSGPLAEGAKISLAIVEYNGAAIGEIVPVASYTKPSPSYVELSGVYTVPERVTKVSVQLSTEGVPSGSFVWFDDLDLRRTVKIQPSGIAGLEGALGDFADLTWGLVNETGKVLGNIGGVVVDVIGSTLQQVWDFIVGGLTGLGLGGLVGGGSTGADVERVALDVAENVAQMQAKIALLQAQAASGAFSGNSSFIDFSLRTNASSLGADFSQTYSGAGTATLGITSGKGAWGGTWNSSPRTGVAVYNAVQTQTDYQRIGVAFASAPTSSGGSNPACNYILGRSNAAGTEYVFVELFPNSCKIGCVASGVTTYGPTSTMYGSFKAGAAYYLECGTTGGDNIFRVYENNRVILTWTDSGNVAKKGASYRYTGVAGYSFANGSYHTTPASMAALSMADNTPLPVLGSGFRRFRASGTSVSQGSGQNLIASNFFDTADKKTDDITWDGASNNKVTVSVSGWYIIAFKVRLVTDTLSTGGTAQPLLYVNGTATQAGWETWYTGPTSWGGSNDTAATWVQYLNAGDYVQPGMSTNRSINIAGGASGAQTNFSVVFLNNTKPS